jgi:hypothetical protein
VKPRYAVSAVVATVGALAGSTLLATTSAQAVARPQVNASYTCVALSAGSPGQIFGYECSGYGQGTGWFYYQGATAPTYRCTIEPVSNFPDPGYNEEGTNCVYVGSPPPTSTPTDEVRAQ